ncbi:MAG: transposase [Acidobacteriota bacterium]|nr:transposase [Acidobacteriota bacterium]
MFDEEFSLSRIPLAYFITFRCYGTWLHGDERGSVDRLYNTYGTPFYPVDKPLEEEERRRMKHSPVELDDARRVIVDHAIREVCQHRKWKLLAINVRTNHVHVVVSATCKPEKVLNDFKAYATRAMRSGGAWSRPASPWSGHGSRRYLWKPQQVECACDYVLNHQGDDIVPDFGDDVE